MLANSHNDYLSGAEAFTVIRFPTPAGGGGIASPVFRTNSSFLQGGLTRGGAWEFVVSNGSVPLSAAIEVVRRTYKYTNRILSAHGSSRR